MTTNQEENESHQILDRDLIPLLDRHETHLRMLALHLLCEGYAASPEISRAVFRGWDTWGPREAFPEFPMLSFFAIDDGQIEECCHRASQMAESRKLVDPECRCAGKLMEQLVELSPMQLKPHLNRIQTVVGESKIFFRVDLSRLHHRVELLDRTAEQLSARLDDAIAKLTANSADDYALQLGINVLEALRRDHAEYLDLKSVLQQGPNAGGGSAASFRMTIHSLIQQAEPGLEPFLAAYLHSDHEFTCVNAVEALVRAGSQAAAEALLNHFEDAEPENQKWVARGLQRIRLRRLAPAIAALRDATRDPHLWLMLLIAEVRQCEVESIERLAFDLTRLRSGSETLVDSLDIYLNVHQDHTHLGSFPDVVAEYLERTGQRGQ